MEDQTLNERQDQICSTCMHTCENLAYPVLGAIEEMGEFIGKLPRIADFDESNPDISYIRHLLRGIETNALALGAFAKAIRHGSMAAPFKLSRMADDEDYESYLHRLDEAVKEIGDIEWDLNVTLRQLGYTAQHSANLNWRKLQERKANGTIDGRGDNERTSID